MKKYLKLFIVLFIALFTVTGCTDDNMDGIDIIVTNYSTEYITKYLYSEHANISSIYPDGVITDNYKLSTKQKKDFSKKGLFIYNGSIEHDRNLAIDLLDLNSDLKIIDTAYVLETDYSPEELWLNPSSLLMMAQNVRIGLEEYITSTILTDEIDKKYEELKVTLSELDAEYRLAIENTDNKKIVVDNAALKYLEKFGLEVYCIDIDATYKTLSIVRNLIENEEISYIYTFKNDDLSDNANELMNTYNVKRADLHKLDIISDTERANDEDYLSIMHKNLDTIKQELYQ